MMVYLKYFTTLFLLTVSLNVHAEDNWILKQKTTGFEYDTETGLGSRKGVTKKGLISVSRTKQDLLLSFWEPGAYRATLNYNGKNIVDGYDLDDVSRVNSFRFDKAGSTVYIRTTKGPSAVVELFQNGEAVLEWPRLSIVKILKYDLSSIYLTIYIDQTQTTEFWRYNRSPSGGIDQSGIKIGELRGCSLLSSKVLKFGIAMETYCDKVTGNDVKFLNFETGEVEVVRATNEDEFLAFSLLKTKPDSIPVLTVTGNDNARYFYHAVSGSIMKLLGEPMSYSSDEGGKQSWSQSYRTITLATTYQKTGRPVFAKLARIAMVNSLGQRNRDLGMSDNFNPPSAWASRIYSEDGKTPVSFMINQAMIMTSLIKSCDLLQNQCSDSLKTEIDQSSIDLIEQYEKWFDPTEQQYKIPYAAPFRFDGIWAPWNWQIMWSSVLKHAGEVNQNQIWEDRANNLGTMFVNSWEISKTDDTYALWRYWTPAYYNGWEQDDMISVSRARQKPKAMDKERYEDLNHAGISLLGLSFLEYELTSKQSQAARNTLDRILSSDDILARDMDRQGPKSPRWLPGAGWHIFGTEKFRNLYTHKLPGASSGDQLLAYAFLYDHMRSFDLNLSLAECNKEECVSARSWVYDSVDHFLDDNPFFSISAK